jgi:hypothetical protein
MMKLQCEDSNGHRDIRCERDPHHESAHLAYDEERTLFVLWYYDSERLYTVEVSSHSAHKVMGDAEIW